MTNNRWNLDPNLAADFSPSAILLHTKNSPHPQATKKHGSDNQWFWDLYADRNWGRLRQENNRWTTPTLAHSCPHVFWEQLKYVFWSMLCQYPPHPKESVSSHLLWRLGLRGNLYPATWASRKQTIPRKTVLGNPDSLNFSFLQVTATGHLIGIECVLELSCPQPTALSPQCQHPSCVSVGWRVTRFVGLLIG